MSKEISVNSSLTVRKIDATSGRTLVDERRTAGFTADMTGNKGPTPGSVLAKLATQGGTQVDLSQLTRPTWAWLYNQGRTDGATPTDGDYVTFGIWNAQSTNFTPIGELAPGEGIPFKFSRDLQEVYEGPGSGSAAAGETARLMLVAHNVQQNFFVGAFEF